MPYVQGTKGGTLIGYIQGLYWGNKINGPFLGSSLYPSFRLVVHSNIETAPEHPELGSLPRFRQGSCVRQKSAMEKVDSSSSCGTQLLDRTRPLGGGGRSWVNGAISAWLGKARLHALKL